MIHELKTWPVAFELARIGAKMFEIRKNDRNFQVGDELLLREYELETAHYTGREIMRAITCVVTGWGIPDDICVLGVAPLFDEPAPPVAAAKPETKGQEK